MRLRNKFLNTESEMNRKTYKKQCTCYVTLIRKAKQIFFGNINTADVTDNKTFGRIVKHFFIKLRLVQNLLSLKKRNDV